MKQGKKDNGELVAAKKLDNIAVRGMDDKQFLNEFIHVMDIHYYRIHHRKRPITAGLFRTGGDSLSLPVPNGPGGDANISPSVRNTTPR